MTLPLPRHPGSEEPPRSLRVGALVGQKYRLEKLLGSGGMGEVYLAVHEQLGSRVAIKVLQEKSLSEPGLRGRFQREAMAAARLASDHIAQVFDVGELENGAPYMVMEYLEGQDLSEYLDQRGMLPVSEVLDLLWQLCNGIAVAHAAGIVHRDLKPANLFLLPRPQGGFLLKILDFGIAKAVEMQASVHTFVPSAARAAPSTQLTDTATLLGSIRYMAPEQMESAKDVDNRADLWSIGVIGYKLLTGKTPFEGDSFEEIFVAMSTRRMVPLAERRPDAPPALVVAIERCLQPAREDRWPSVAALQATLADAFPRPSATTVIPAEPPPPAPSPPAHPAPSNTGLKIAVGLLAGVLLGGIGLAGACVGLGVYAGSSTATTPLPIRETHHVEPLDLLPFARARARSYSSAAALSFIMVTGAPGGAVDLDDSSKGTVNFTFATPKTSSQSLMILASGSGMTSQPSNSPVAAGATDPRCRYAQAWKAAVGAGLQASLLQEATYNMVTHNSWNFRGATSAGEKSVEVDGQTCVAGHLH